ncbi:MAG: hypothetical protein NT154_34845, partial [Verrucomicrobia bacterium]|nr:hypothetical protein [Verrucomicrobiota bacterium]
PPNTTNPTKPGPGTLVLTPTQGPKLSVGVVVTNGVVTAHLTWSNDGGTCVPQSTSALTLTPQWQTLNLPIETLPDGSKSVTVTNLSTTCFFRLCCGCP